MLTFEIYFSDLSKEAQERLLVEMNTSESQENFAICALAIFEREEDDEVCGT